LIFEPHSVVSAETFAFINGLSSKCTDVLISADRANLVTKNWWWRSDQCTVVPEHWHKQGQLQQACSILLYERSYVMSRW